MLPLIAQQLFGAHLRQQRVQQGLSQAELADLLALPTTETVVVAWF